jgi:hypothetical protein
MGGQISSQVTCEQETYDQAVTEIANLALTGEYTRSVPRENIETPKISFLTTTVKSRPSSTNEWWRKSQASTPLLGNPRVNGMLKERLAGSHDTLAQRILELRRAENIASEATDAKTTSERLVKGLLVIVRTLEIDNSRLTNAVHSAARLQAKTEQELTDLFVKRSEEREEAVDAKAAFDQLVSSLSATNRALETDKSCLTKRVISAAQLQAKTEQELESLRHPNSLIIKRLEERECNLARQLTHAHESHAKTNDDLSAATVACAELRAAKTAADCDNTALRERLQQLQLENHDDSDLYEWDWTESGGLVELVSRSLHGSDIMPLISLESPPEFIVTCIAELMFEPGPDRLASWLLCWNQDKGISSQLIHVVHLLNDFQAFYGSNRDKAHISPDGSQRQTSRIKLLLLELLRSNGRCEHAKALFSAILSCFSGRTCLKKLQHFGIFLDCHERQLLAQACHDRRHACGSLPRFE